MGISGELPTFPHVDEVHEVHEVHATARLTGNRRRAEWEQAVLLSEACLVDSDLLVKVFGLCSLHAICVFRGRGQQLPSS